MAVIRSAPGYGTLTHIQDPRVRDALRTLSDRISKVDEVLQNLQDIAIQADETINGRTRRFINALDPEDPQDLVTLIYLKRYVNNQVALLKQQLETGGPTGPCAGSAEPLVDLPDFSAEVEAYGAANPAALANSCQSGGGSWEFMDGLVAHLQSLDERFGFLGQRGDPDDLAEDAITYYHGALPPVAGSLNTYGVDVIAGHCGPDPQAAWIDVTDFCGAGAAWVPTRA